MYADWDAFACNRCSWSCYNCCCNNKILQSSFSFFIFFLSKPECVYIRLMATLRHLLSNLAFSFNNNEQAVNDGKKSISVSSLQYNCLYPTPLEVQGCITFEWMNTIPRKTCNKPLFYYIDPFKLVWPSVCWLSLLYSPMQPKGRKCWGIFIEFGIATCLGTRTNAIECYWHRRVFN